MLEYVGNPRNKVDLLINLFESRPEETASRILLINTEESTKTPVMHSPGINEDMLALELAFPQLRRDADRLKEIFRGADQVRITSPAGTDIALSLAGREGLDDIAPFIEGGELVSNYPCGEAFWAPVETTGQGKMVVDGTISVFGDPGTPLQIDVVGGRIAALAWLDPQAGEQDLLDRIIKELSKDGMASTIGELGIGLVSLPLDGENRQKFMPFMLASEKARKTAHIAFGHNLDMHGQNSSKTHNDFLMLEPTISITFVDGRPPRLVMSAGELLFTP
jgi:leucyl aminopeptidase (aminopeptidase T)